MGRKSNATKAAELAAQGVADDVATVPSVGPSIVTAHDPRNDMIEALAESVINERREYAAYHGADFQEDDVKEVVAEETAETAEETEEVEGAAETVAEVEEVQEDLVTLKIDGKEQQVPRSQVEEYGIRALQKELAADRKLEEATRILNEAKQKFTQPSPDVANQSPSNDAAELAKAIQYGSEDEAVQAIKNLQGRNTATPDQIALMVDQRVQFLNAAQWFESEYPEIVKDPYLMQIVINAEDQRRTQGDSRTFREIYKEIGDEVRSWRDKIAGPSHLEDKRAKKAAVQTIPSASVRQTPPEPEKTESAADVVDQIRRARGQA